MSRDPVDPVRSVAHLEPVSWAEVNRRLAAKAIGEFAHELLIQPALERADADAGSGEYVLAADDPSIEYRFRAQVLSLEHWAIDAASIRKTVAGQQAPIDVLQLIVELNGRLAIPPELLPEYLHELANTLYGAACKQTRAELAAAELARADFQTLEGAMREGHPIFVANNARLGFEVRDHLRYAPEVAADVALLWLAARKSRAAFACVDDHGYAELIREELAAADREAFDAVLRARGCDPADYVLLPVHPWQWQNRLAQLFAPDLATGDLVYLGASADRYQAQQSIRTLFNLSHPEKRYVKTALSIRNMGFSRGISASITERSAAVNDWVSRLVRGDAYLQRCGFEVLREVAFVGYRHRHFERASNKRSDGYKEMLAALWRESPARQLRSGRRLMTMAALMHTGSDGVPLLPALIKASGAGVEAWLERYLDCYLKPLLHCFYAHRLTFMPHCENIILVLEGDLPVGLFIKDLAEDIGVLNPQTPLPEAVRHLGLRVPDEVMTLAIFTDVFDCVFRFIAPILHLHAGYPERRFWRAVAACIRRYEAEQPQLAEEFRRYDLFAPAFIRNCLNRLQLRNARQMIDLNAPDPVDSLQFAGTLRNPIAAHRASAVAAVQPVHRGGSHGIA